MRRLIVSGVVLTVIVVLVAFGAGSPARPGLADMPTPTATDSAQVECPTEGLPADQVVATVNFPAGWNMVSGPDGSCLHGATAAYLFEGGEGSGHYTDFLVTISLGISSGVWAYFPSGGSVQLSKGYVSGPEPGDEGPPGNQGSCGSDAGQVEGFVVAAASSSGGWRMVGNESPYGPEEITSETLAVLAYSPDRGYYPTSEIPLGQAVWVLPVSGDEVGVRPPNPPANETPAPLTDCRGLAAVALRHEELPGYTLLFDGHPRAPDDQVIASYSAFWLAGDRESLAAALLASQNPDLSGYPIVANTLITYSSPQAAHAALGSLVTLREGANAQVVSLGSQGIGDEDMGEVLSGVSQSGVSTTVYVELFRRGALDVFVLTSGPAGSASIDQAVSLARIVDARLVAAQQ
jgi:hypothetical protein